MAAVAQVLSPRIWFLGAPLLVALFLWRPSPMLILIGIMALPDLRAAWNYDPQRARSPAPQTACRPRRASNTP